MQPHRLPQQNTQRRLMHTTPTQSMATPKRTRPTHQPHQMAQNPPNHPQTRPPHMRQMRTTRQHHRPHHPRRSQRRPLRPKQPTNTLHNLQQPQKPRRPKKLPQHLPKTLRVGGVSKKHKTPSKSTTPKLFFSCLRIFERFLTTIWALSRHERSKQWLKLDEKHNH